MFSSYTYTIMFDYLMNHMRVYYKVESIVNRRIYYLCAKTTSTRYSMQVCVGIFWHVVIEYNVHTFYIHTPSEQICRHQNTLKMLFVFHILHKICLIRSDLHYACIEFRATYFLEIFKLLISGQSLLLRHAPMNSNRREILFRQKLC